MCKVTIVHKRTLIVVAQLSSKEVLGIRISNISTDPTNKAKRSVCFGGDQLYMLRPLKSVGNGCA